MKMNTKLAVVMGVFCAMEGWNLICLTTNFVHIRKARIPGDMQHLLEAATKTNLTIEEPGDQISSVLLDIVGFGRQNMTDMDIPPDAPLGELYRRAVLRHLSIKIAFHLIVLCFEVAKLYFGYHQFIYRVTAHITGDTVYRSLCYFAFDNFITQSCSLPIEFLRVVVTNNHKELPALQLKLTWNAIAALVTALTHYLMMNLIEKIGILGWCPIPFIVKTIELTITNLVIASMKMSPPPVLDGDLEKSLESLFVKTKYPKMIIQEHISEDLFPLVCHFSGLLEDVIAYTPQLLKRLANDKVVGIVAHELGKRSYLYWPFFYLVDFVKTVAVCYVAVKSYGSTELEEMFGFFNDSPHPAVSLYLGQSYILPLIHWIINWISNYGFRRYVYMCDYYACRQGYSAALKRALSSLAGTSNRYPVFDSPFYTMFISKVPTIPQRILEIELYEFYQNRQQ